MPKCAEGYRTERINKLMDGRSVVDVALDVAMTIKGSMENSKKALEEDVEILNFYLNNWLFPNDEFDQCVLNMITTAYSMYYRDKTENI